MSLQPKVNRREDASAETIPDKDIFSPSRPPQVDSDLDRRNTTPKLDIGLALYKGSSLTAQERLQFLENTWDPPDDFTWPYTERKDGNNIRRKYLGRQHLSGVNDVFAYSQVQGGIFCKVCVLFAADVAGGNSLDRRVKSPLNKYAHLTSCVMKAASLKATLLDKSGDVCKQLNTEFSRQRDHNRNVLQRILTHCKTGSLRELN